MSFSGLIKTLNAVKSGTASMEEVPEMFWQPNTWGSDFLLELTKFHWTTIYRVPDEEMSPEIVQAALNQTGLALFHIPIALRSHEVCETALKSTLAALSAVPEHLLPLFLDFAIKQLASSPDLWDEVPKEFRTEAYAVRAVRCNPFVIDHIPAADQTQAICEAFLQDGTAWLEDVKAEARSRMLCLVCLKSARGSLSAVPDRWLDAEIEEIDRQGKLLLAEEEAEYERRRAEEPRMV